MKNSLNLKFVIVIILASVILSVIFNYFSSDGIPFIRKPIVVSSVDLISDTDSSQGIRGLNLANTIALFNRKNTIFIDARDQWEYSEGHIKGAINIPEFSFTEDNKKLNNIPHESLLVIYCYGDDCDTSKRLLLKLMNLGYSNSFLFLGGFSEWKEADLPVEEVTSIE